MNFKQHHIRWWEWLDFLVWLKIQEISHEASVSSDTQLAQASPMAGDA
jgi:hypothetical protein